MKPQDRIGRKKKGSQVNDLSKGRNRNVTRKRRSSTKAESISGQKNIVSKKRTKQRTKQRTKRKKKNLKIKKRKQRHQFYKEIGISFFLMISLFFLLKGLFFSFPIVNGYGMTPNLNDGDRLFVSNRAKIKRFDLVYFKNPITDQLMIRRVVALPGEEIAYENDELMINQKLVVERFLKNEVNEAQSENRLLTENFSLAGLTKTRALPEDCYFVLGDNRHYAADSRQFGWIDSKDILGVVKARLLPIHGMTQF